MSLSSDARAIGRSTPLPSKTAAALVTTRIGQDSQKAFAVHCPMFREKGSFNSGAEERARRLRMPLLTLGAGELSIIDTERQRAASLAEALRARYGADRAQAK